MQALFAHILIQLGGVVTEVNTTGHPDVRATIGDRDLHVQVKTAKHGSPATVFQMSSADFQGITCPTGHGFLAYLDCAEPVRWILVPHARARRLMDRAVHVATLQAECDDQLSSECTGEFVLLIMGIKDQLCLLPYDVLRSRALAGQAP